MAGKGRTAAARRPVDWQEIKNAATARVLARRQAPEFREWQDPKSGGTGRIQVDRPEFRPPANAGEWWDDRLARLHGPYPAILYVVADAARDGETAALAAVQAARSAPAWDQWQAYYLLGSWVSLGPHAEAEPVLRAVLREWRRLGLATAMPDEQVQVVTLNQAELDAADGRRRRREQLVTPAGPKW